MFCPWWLELGWVTGVGKVIDIGNRETGEPRGPEIMSVQRVGKNQQRAGRETRSIFMWFKHRRVSLVEGVHFHSLARQAFGQLVVHRKQFLVWGQRDEGDIHIP